MPRITALTANNSPTSDDLLVCVDSPGGTPVTKKLTIAALFSKTPPIEFNTPSVTYGLGVLAKTPTEIAVTVPAGQELSLFNIWFHNTGPATSMFYGLRMITTADAVDTGAAIAIGNFGRADGMYIGVHGVASGGSNGPCGIGIDINNSLYPDFIGYGIGITDKTLTSQVIGTDTLNYTCIVNHTAAAANKPITGGSYATYWTQTGSGGVAWVDGTSYINGTIGSNVTGPRCLILTKSTPDNLHDLLWMQANVNAIKIYTPAGALYDGTKSIISVVGALYVEKFAVSADGNLTISNHDSGGVAYVRAQCTHVTGAQDAYFDCCGKIVGAPSTDIKGRFWASSGSLIVVGALTNHPLTFGMDYTANPLTAEKMRLTVGGNLGIGLTVPTAVLHLKAGTATASTAPLKFSSGISLTTAEAGAMEFTTDDLYFTITTGAARKGVILNDGTTLTSGRVPFATTNGRLKDDSDMTFAGSRLTVTDLTVTSAPIISSLTAGRVIFAGASKELVDDADFTFVTDTLTVTKIAATTITGNMTISDVNLVLGTATGTKIGTATAQKLGFYNATPVVQPTAVADSTDASSVILRLNELLARMRTLGLIAT